MEWSSNFTNDTAKVVHGNSAAALENLILNHENKINVLKSNKAKWDAFLVHLSLCKMEK